MPHRQPPPDLAQWSLHCFCPKARRNPRRVVELDNNGQILHRAVGGTTLEDIRQLPCSDSQLVLLSTFGLIERHEDQLRTRIPVLGPEAVEAVREVAADMANVALRDVPNSARTIVEVMTARGLASSSHAIVFGHALDGVLWDVLRQRGSLPEVDLTVDEPLWRGALWAVYPGREGSAGTNERTVDNATLVMVWDDESVEALWELESHPGTEQLLKTVQTGKARVSLSPILGDDFVVPIITPDDEIHLVSLALAGTVTDAMPTARECRSLLASADVDASAEEATVIVAHEMIWEVAARLADSGVVDVPAGPNPARRVFVRIDP